MKYIAALLLTILVNTIAQTAQAQTEQTYTQYTRYAPSGQVLGTISAKPNNNQDYLAERFTYNADGLVQKVEKGTLKTWQDEGIEPERWPLEEIYSVQTNEYDDFGRKSSETSLGKNGIKLTVMEFSYDEKSRVQCKAVRMKFTATGNACSSTNLTGPNPDRISRYYYDDLDQVYLEKRALGTDKEQNYQTNHYDEFDKRVLRAQVDANCNKTAFGYDNFFRLQFIYYPESTIKVGETCTQGNANTNDFQEFRYDNNGNKTYERKRNGKYLTNRYDNNNRLVFKDYNDNTTLHDIAYEYDLRGLQLKARFDDLTGQGLTQEYDGFGNLISSTNSMTGVTRTVKSSFDLNNNRESVTHPDNQTFYYAFDGLNRVTGVGTNSFSRENLVGIKYQANGRRQNIMRPNGSTTTYNFNNGVLLSSFSQTFVSNTFGSGSNDTTNRFEYNAAGQITLLGQSNKLYNYTGNEDRTGAYTRDGLNRYRIIGDKIIDYDANSNLIKDGFNTYTYDDENRLLTASGTGGNAQFLYDPNGRLFQYVINGNVRQFVYDGDALIGDYLNDKLDNRFVHGDQVDEPWVRFRGSKITDDVKFYLHSNHQGSIIAESSQTGSGSGSVTSTLAYDAFGIAGQNNVGVFGYTGQMYLKELGLYYYKARIYSPKLGRFMQTDPIGYKDDMNLYAYVGNDPVNKTDPTGLAKCGSSLSESKCETAQGAAIEARQTAQTLSASFKGISSRMASGNLTAADNKQLAGLSNLNKSFATEKGLNQLAKGMDKIASSIGVVGKGVTLLQGNNKHEPGKITVGYVPTLSVGSVGVASKTIYLNDAFFDAKRTSTNREAFMLHEAAHTAGKFGDIYGATETGKLNGGALFNNADSYACLAYPNDC